MILIKFYVEKKNSWFGGWIYFFHASLKNYRLLVTLFILHPLMCEFYYILLKSLYLFDNIFNNMCISKYLCGYCFNCWSNGLTLDMLIFSLDRWHLRIFFMFPCNRNMIKLFSCFLVKVIKVSQFDVFSCCILKVK